MRRRVPCEFPADADRSVKLVRAVDMRCFDLTEGGIRPILSEVRRVLAAITLMVLLVAVSGGLWAWWAENEYAGLVAAHTAFLVMATQCGSRWDSSLLRR